MLIIINGKPLHRLLSKLVWAVAPSGNRRVQGRHADGGVDECISRRFWFLNVKKQFELHLIAVVIWQIHTDTLLVCLLAQEQARVWVAQSLIENCLSGQILSFCSSSSTTSGVSLWGRLCTYGRITLTLSCQQLLIHMFTRSLIWPHLHKRISLSSVQVNQPPSSAKTIVAKSYI